jgi:hypothetical protein
MLIAYGWRLVMLAVAMVFGGSYGQSWEPAVYQVFPPSPTITKTPTITITPTITLTSIPNIYADDHVDPGSNITHPLFQSRYRRPFKRR